MSIFATPSYSVISLQTPDANALRQKPENKRRDLRLKQIANRDPRRRIRCVDQLENVFGD
jgi:hypothetical protein